MNSRSFDALAKRLANRGRSQAQNLPTGPDAATQEHDRLFNALAGERAPGFNLAVLGEGRVTLDTLLAPAKPLLLVFTDPRCGPCYELLPDIGGWQRVYGDRLTIALISSGAPESNLAMTGEYGIRSVLLQASDEVVLAYGLVQAPAAVLIQPDGRVLAGPRYGANAVRKLVADTLGLVLPEAPRREIKAVGTGQAAPPIRRPDLAGNVIDLAALRGAPTLMLFWSPGCSHCQEVLPEIKAFEQVPGHTRTVVVSRGPIALNQAAGFASPLVLDDDEAIAKSFGVSGTPAALVLDAGGRVATPVARGASGIRTALQAVLALTTQASAAD
jgi:thiol-disulfide isomerase/thioredoxin